MPKVSICIPTYNQGRYIGECVRSALNQTLDDIEVIVSVNHCTDDTEEVLKGFSDPRLVIVKPPEFLQMFDNFNFCISHVKGRYFTFLCSDDILFPEFAALQSMVLDEHQNVVFVHSAAELINKDGRVVGREKSIHKSFVRKGTEEIRRYIYGPRCVGDTAMIRKSAYDMVGGFKSLKIIGDWDLWLRLLQVGDVAYNQQTLLKYRYWLDEEGTRSHTQRLLTQAEETIALYEEYEPKLLEKHHDLRNDFARARERQALSFVFSLASVDDIELRGRIADAILRLSNSWRVRLVLNALNIGAGPALLLWRSFKLGLRQKVKALLYPN